MRLVECEAVLVGRNGYVITLRLHPADAPASLLEAPIGERLYCVFQGYPETAQEAEAEAGERAVMQAGMLCRSRDFALYVQSLGLPNQEEECASYLRSVLGIRSRAELRTNLAARHQFFLLKALVEDWSRDRDERMFS